MTLCWVPRTSTYISFTNAKSVHSSITTGISSSRTRETQAIQAYSSLLPRSLSSTLHARALHHSPRCFPTKAHMKGSTLVRELD